MGASLGGPPSLGCLMINLLSQGETYNYFFKIILDLTNLHVNTILYTKLSDLNHMNNNDGYIQGLFIDKYF